MIRDPAAWQQWEDNYYRNSPPVYTRNLALYEAMYRQARLLGLFPLAQPLKGIEDKIHLARVINVSAGINPGPRELGPALS